MVTPSARCIICSTSTRSKKFNSPLCPDCQDKWVDGFEPIQSDRNPGVNVSYVQTLKEFRQNDPDMLKSWIDHLLKEWLG